jgi:hypothetical protein
LAVLDLKELDPEDAEDDEEGAADEDNVPDGLEGGEEGLHHQLQPGGSVDHPAQQLVQSAAIVVDQRSLWLLSSAVPNGLTALTSSSTE